MNLRMIIRQSTQRKHTAFTLIELLIVVAIIAILAAIAVPNFLEAQTRSKVSRVKSDLRTLSITLESYRVDHDSYPVWPDFPDRALQSGDFADEDNPFVGFTPPSLTTPLAYITSLPKDSFVRLEDTGRAVFNPNYLDLFWYDSDSNTVRVTGNSDLWPYVVGTAYKWILSSNGPDLITANDNQAAPTNNIYEFFQTGDAHPIMGPGMYYDPTNGTMSFGDIVLTGPGGGYEHQKTDTYR